MRRFLAVTAAVAAVAAAALPAHAAGAKPPGVIAKAGSVAAPAASPYRPSAEAQPACSFTGITPSAVTLGPTAANITFGVTGGCPHWSIEIDDTVTMYADDTQPVVLFDRRNLVNTNAGKHTATVVYCDADEVCDGTTVTFVLRRYTSFGGTFDAAEPAVENTTLRMTGTLQRYNWETGRFDGYGPSGAVVYAQFQPVGGHFFDYKQVPVGKAGVTPGAVVAHVDGAWRYRFPGNISSGASWRLRHNVAFL
jgi:hypothetical protein